VRYGQRLIEGGKKRTRRGCEVNLVLWNTSSQNLSSWKRGAGNGDRYSKSASIKRSRV